MSEVGQTIIDAVRSTAARNPSFVYPNPGLNGWETDPTIYCVYVRDGNPSCLIGCALWDLGIIDASLEQHPYNTVGVDDLFAWLDDVELDPDEIQWLRYVQTGQDAEKPWAEAVKWVDNYKEEMLQDW